MLRYTASWIFSDFFSCWVYDIFIHDSQYEELEHVRMNGRSELVGHHHSRELDHVALVFFLYRFLKRSNIFWERPNVETSLIPKFLTWIDILEKNDDNFHFNFQPMSRKFQRLQNSWELQSGNLQFLLGRWSQLGSEPQYSCSELRWWIVDPFCSTKYLLRYDGIQEQSRNTKDLLH